MQIFLALAMVAALLVFGAALVGAFLGLLGPLASLLATFAALALGWFTSGRLVRSERG